MQDIIDKELRVRARYEYIGWVPCVTGHLIFDYVNCGIGDKICLANHVEKYNNKINQYALVHSLVNWKDFDDAGKDGLFSVLFIAERKIGSSRIKGSVYIANKGNDAKAWGAAINQVRAIQQVVNNEINNIGEHKKVAPMFSELKEKLGAARDNPSIYQVRFTLNEQGFVKLHYVDSEDKYTASHRETIARQSYYYIKYTFHQHQHHHSTAESLTSIHKYAFENRKNIGMELIRDLRSSIVLLKREVDSSRYFHVYRSLGIISYANSLVESCIGTGYLDKATGEKEQRYFSNAKDSLESKANHLQNELLRSGTNSSNARSFVLFIFALIMPIVIVYREKITPIGEGSERVADLLNSAFSTPASLLALVTLSLMVYVGHAAIHKRFGKWSWAIKFYRIFWGRIFNDNYKGTIMVGLVITFSFGMVLYFAATSIFGVDINDATSRLMKN